MRAKDKKKSRVCQGDLSQDTVFNQNDSAFTARFWDSVGFDMLIPTERGTTLMRDFLGLKAPVFCREHMSWQASEPEQMRSAWSARET